MKKFERRVAVILIFCFGTFLFGGGALFAQRTYETVEYTYIDDKPLPALTAETVERGFMYFRTNYLDMVMRQTIPLGEQLDVSLRAFASLGEHEPVSFAIRSLRDLKDVRVSLSGLEGPEGAFIGPESIDIRSVRFLREMILFWDPRTHGAPDFSGKNRLVEPAC